MDIELNFTEKGTGSPLILLHGNGEDHTYFREQIDVFAEKRRVIAIDTRGHGKTPLGTAPFTLAQCAEDLKDFMDRHGIPKADILGFSDGGNIALIFAVRYKHMIGRLILDGANIFLSGLKTPFLLSAFFGRAFTALASPFSGKARKQVKLFDLMLKEPHIDPERLGEIDVPALVIAGTNDLIKHSHTELIARSLPNAELCIIKGDHFIARKNPAGFNRAVLSFLDRKNTSIH